MATDFQPLIDAVKSDEGIDGLGVALFSIAVCVLAACGSLSMGTRVTDEGAVRRVVFPDAQHRAVVPQGTWPAVAAIGQAAPGMDKEQLRALLGPPHFGEGRSGVQEWDYIFHFRAGALPSTCQYKVIFDKAGRARSFHWLPADCGARGAKPGKRQLLV